MSNKDKLYVQFKEEGDNGECTLLVSHDNIQWSGGSIMTLTNLVELYKELGEYIDSKTDYGEKLWEEKIRRDFKEYISNPPSCLDLSRVLGGSWLGYVREWIQRKASNGDSVNWGSQDYLDLRPLTVADMELLAASIAENAIKDFISDSKFKYINKLLGACNVL